ncbi:polyketide cyclase [bacterium]|nr:MAG: polyketide cyclase [bacterium]
MTQSTPYQPDPKLDLVLERVTDVAPELVWIAWTTPELLVKWFTPAPWKTVKVELDLYPGGQFHTTMESPEGQQFPNTGCVLEVVEGKKFVWTGALLPGFRPNPAAFEQFAMSVIILIEPEGEGTKYTAIAIHSDEEGAQKHEAMGFSVGWGAAFDQLVALAKTL